LISEAPQSATGAQRRDASRGKRARSPLRQALFGLAIVLYTLLFAEAFIRVFDPQALMPRYITGTAWGVRGNIPNAHYWHHTPEVDVQYRINGQGLRADRDYPFGKPPGTCRIAVFGDSFLFGLEVELKDTFGDRLEKRLQQRGIRAEVLNFAVGGFGTAEMLQTYEQFGRKFDPDVVIFSWDLSDLNDNVRSDLYRLEDGRLERAHATYLPAVNVQDLLMRYRVYRFIADHSELYTFVRERLNTALKQRAVTAQNERLGASRSGVSEGETTPIDDDIDELQHRNKLDLSAAILLFAHDQIVSSGREFYLLDIPARQSRTEFASTIGLLPESVRTRINVVSPVAALVKAARPDLKLYYEKGLGHFTPTGMEIIVDDATKTLASSARLAACVSSARR
jgi:hypothetical protein